MLPLGVRKIQPTQLRVDRIPPRGHADKRCRHMRGNKQGRVVGRFQAKKKEIKNKQAKWK